MEIINKLKDFLMTESSADLGLVLRSINLDDNLFDLGIIDSMGILKVISFMEDSFGIKILDEDIVPENFQTLNHLRQMVESKLNKEA